MNNYSLNQIPIVNFSSPWVWLAILVHALLIYLALINWNKTKVISFAIGFYLISIFLYSNLLITIGTSFGERLLFIPSLGFCLLLAFLIQFPFRNKIKAERLFKTASTPLLITGVLVGVYSSKTIDRNQAWKDNFTLYSTDVENCDQSARCHYYYGLGLMKEKALLEPSAQEKRKLIIASIEAFQQAIQILPTYGDAWGQIGLAYFRLEDYQNAEKHYLKALQFAPQDATVLSNLGSMYFQLKRYQEAKGVYERALRANPNHIDALANYGATLGTLGNYSLAITYFQRAIALKPNQASYYQMVGMTYQNMGNQQQAAVYLKKAQELRQ